MKFFQLMTPELFIALWSFSIAMQATLTVAAPTGHPVDARALDPMSYNQDIAGREDANALQTFESLEKRAGPRLERRRGACVRCRKAKTTCHFDDGKDKCRSCAAGNHECHQK
ncbi:hypothetical protein C8J56DRAFT_1031363 [Mycena floridula]|nr:hypothetical protein C8J56DRAFT_1031363 [Mycena floridula]